MRRPSSGGETRQTQQSTTSETTLVSVRGHIFHLQFSYVLVVRLAVRSEETLVTDEVCLALPKWLKRPLDYTSEMGVVSESKGLLQQVRGYGKPVLLGDSLLDGARIIAIDRVVKHLMQKR
jgi:hypothetical protein